MKTSIIITILMICTVLFAGNLPQKYMQAQSFGHTRGADPKGGSDAPKATGGIINSSTKIVIQTGAYVVIAGAGNYTSEGSGSLPSGGTLDLTGNFLNSNTSGEPVSTTGTVLFSGTTAQSISGNPLTFGNVSFDNPAGISIGCDTDIGGNLTVSGTSGIIDMTDYDFGVTGSVTGTPEIVVTGSGAVGEVGANANVTVDSPQPTGLPAVMNTLDVNPGAAQSYQLPNSTSVANLTFSSGNLSFGAHNLLLRNQDLVLGGENALSALTAALNPVPGTFGEHSSINKTWNITGQSSGNLTITLRWLDSENNGNDFTSGFANVFAHNGTTWIGVGRYAISIDGSYNLVSFARSLGTKDGENDYTITGDDQTLPVELTSFTALATENLFVKLSWTTQSETNLNGYYIYRNTDVALNSAVCINTLLPAANSSSTTDYSYTDNEVETGNTYYYWLQALDLDGTVTYHGPISVLLANPGEDNTPPEIPVVTSLLPAYPNPFNPSTTIGYRLKQPEAVKISIFNTKGQRVRHFSQNHSSGGNFRILWDGKSDTGTALSSGIYYITMQAGKATYQTKAVLVK